MQQIGDMSKIKKTTEFVVFLSDNNSWWSIKDVKITSEEMDTAIFQEIKGMLADLASSEK